MSEHRRHVLEKTDVLDNLPGHKPQKAFTIFGVILLLSAGITAWVLYIKYSI